jgi:hypothetical protein
MAPEHPDFERHPSESRAYYEKACMVARAIAAELDPDLIVSVDTVTVEPDEPSMEEYQTYVLRFSHGKEHRLAWTMEIDGTDHYIDNELKEAVRSIYDRKKGEL